MRRRSARCCGGVLVLALATAGCASLAPRPAEFERDLIVPAVPFLAQREHGCAPAALAMLFGARGIAATPDELTPLLVIPDRAGTLQAELLAQARRRGFIALTIAPDIAALAAELDAGRPVLVLQNNGLSWYPVWHYAVVVGYDATQDALLLHSGVTERMRIARDTFDHTWKRSGRWGFVLLEPGELPIHADPEDYAVAVAAFEGQASATEAIAAWQAGRTAWPERWEFAFGLGNRRLADGDAPGAVLALTAAAALAPRQPAVLNNLAVALMERGQWADAEATAAAAAAISSAPAVRETLAEARCRREATCIGRALRMSPGD